MASVVVILPCWNSEVARLARISRWCAGEPHDRVVARLVAGGTAREIPGLELIGESRFAELTPLFAEVYVVEHRAVVVADVVDDGVAVAAFGELRQTEAVHEPDHGAPAEAREPTREPDRSGRGGGTEAGGTGVRSPHDLPRDGEADDGTEEGTPVSGVRPNGTEAVAVLRGKA